VETTDNDWGVSRRNFLRSLGATTLYGMCGPLACSAPAKTERPPRVLLIVIDSLRADHLSSYGYDRETTPFLDELAKDMVRFEWAISPADHTMRSVAAMFAGKYFSQMYAEPKHARGISDNEVSLAEYLSRHEIRCLGWSTNPYASEKYGTARGYENFDLMLPANAPKASIDEIINNIANNYRRSDGKEFIYVHTMDVHLPYRPSMPFDDLFAEKYERTFVREGYLRGADNVLATSNHPYFSEKHELAAKDIQFIKALYDGTIRETDDRLPELLEALQFDPQSDALIIASDHGKQFFERSFWGHGKSTLIEEIRVPLFFRPPGGAKGSRQDVVSNLDIYPTVCESLDLEPPKGLSGQTLIPIVAEEPAESRYVYSEGSPYVGPCATLIGNEWLYHIRSKQYMLEPWEQWPYKERLFHLSTDPKCRKDVANDKPENATQMNDALRLFNRRFEEFRRTSITRPSEIQYGHNVLSAPQIPGGESEKSALPAIAISSDNPVRINDPYHSVTWSGKLERFRLYSIQVTYTLENGDIEFSLDCGDQEGLWTYEAVKPTDGSRELVAALTTPGGNCTLRATPKTRTVATIHRVAIRRIDARLIPLGSWSTNAATSGVDEQVEIDASERERLEALGYVE